MDTVCIRQAIAQAIDHENNACELRHLLGQRMGRLHSAIHLPARAPVERLMAFIIHYAEHVPAFLDALQGIAPDTGTEELADAATELIAELFVCPPQLLNGHNGLNAAMCEAYLAHRLIQEANDQLASRQGALLLAMDMTRSDLIVHQLIGEPFANQLDKAVAIMARNLLAEHPVSAAAAEQASRAGWTRLRKQWPCLTDNLAADLLVYGNGGSPSLH